MPTASKELHEKPRFPASVARDVAEFICTLLSPACSRLIIAGSLRRQRPTVGDVEILYVPTTQMVVDQRDLFGAEIEANLADDMIAGLEARCELGRRRNVNGSEIFGAKNKLMVHVPSGIPVDLFATTEECWWNYLVCRTGGAENNVAICNAAIVRGEKWNPYGPGFTRNNGIKSAMTSEEHVFRFVGLPYLQPKDRP